VASEHDGFLLCQQPPRLSRMNWWKWLQIGVKHKHFGHGFLSAQMRLPLRG